MSSPAGKVPGVLVREGIGRVPGFVNAYVLATPKGDWMIDTSFSKKAKKVLQAFETAGEPTKNVTNILLTHHHFDHMGGAARLHELSNAPVVAHPKDAPTIDGREKPRMNFLLRMLFSARTVPVATLVEDGQMVGPLRVIHVPGHTWGSVAFYEPERKWLFAGDALREEKGRLGLPAARYADDVAQAVGSLKKLQGLDVELMLPGHGEPVGKDFPALLDDLIKRAPGEFLGK